MSTDAIECPICQTTEKVIKERIKTQFKTEILGRITIEKIKKTLDKEHFNIGNLELAKVVFVKLKQIIDEIISK